MIKFPESAYAGKLLPKEAFYKHLKLSAALKQKFVSDVKRIAVEYSITPASLNVAESDGVSEILVLSVLLKGEDIDRKIIEAIAKQNPHKLVFELCADDKACLAVYYNKLYMTEWNDAGNVSLQISGNSMATLWEGFVSQIAVDKTSDASEKTEHNPGNLDETLVRNAKIDRLKREIARLDKRSRAETQPGIKFDIYKQYQEKCRELEKLEGKGGAAE